MMEKLVLVLQYTKNLDVLDDLLGGDARIVGVLTVGSSSLTLDGSNNQVKVGTALTLGHTLGLIHTQNSHADGFEINNVKCWSCTDSCWSY